MPIILTSPAFKEGGIIPKKYTGFGDDVSPPLKWNRAPDGAKSLAILCNDPDAPGGNFVHWLLFDIPAGTLELPENIPKKGMLVNGAKQGITDFGSVGYGGPHPPSGIHRYIFRIIALDTVLGSEPGISEKNLLGVIKGRILDEGRLMGTCGR